MAQSSLNQPFAKKFKLKRPEDEGQSQGPTLASVAGNIAKMGLAMSDSGGQQGDAAQAPENATPMDATSANDAAQTQQDPLDSIPRKPDAAMGEKQGMDSDMARILVAGLPIILGAAFGGAEGGATGAQAGMAGLNAFQQQDALAASKEEKAADRLAAQQAKEADWANEEKQLAARQAFEEKQLAARQAFDEKSSAKKFEQDKYLASIKEKRDAAKDNPSEMPVEKRLAKLNATEKKDLSNIKTVFQSANGMGLALQAGEGTNKIIGDNNFTRFRRDYSEAITRLQSGGAFSQNEADTFKAMAPQGLDPDEMKMQKIQAIKDRMADRLSVYGFKPEEFPDMLKEPKLAKVEKTWVDRLTAIGNQAQANEQSPQKNYEEMSEKELEEELKRRGLK
jgi:hypothetical protein